MPSMYQQNAINTYVKYISIKMLHTSHAMQFVTILCHTMHINKMLETHMPSMYQSKCHILVVQLNL